MLNTIYGTQEYQDLARDVRMLCYATITLLAAPNANALPTKRSHQACHPPSRNAMCENETLPNSGAVSSDDPPNSHLADPPLVAPRLHLRRTYGQL